MKTNLSYQDAFKELEKLVEEIEDDKIQLDKLAPKVGRANELVKFCQGKLRNIEIEIAEAISGESKSRKGKK